MAELASGEQRPITWDDFPQWFQRSILLMTNSLVAGFGLGLIYVMIVMSKEGDIKEESGILMLLMISSMTCWIFAGIGLVFTFIGVLTKRYWSQP